MILYYAVGGGLGHVSRSLAIIHTLIIPSDEIIILSSIKNVAKIFKTTRYKHIPVHDKFDKKPDEYEAWLKNILDNYAIKQVFLDAFPFGIKYEWENIALFCPQIKFTYIARLLNKETVNQIITRQKICYTQTFICEKIENQQHLSFINNHSEIVSNLELSYPVNKKISLTYKRLFLKIKKDDNKLYLIVHSGSENEIEMLLDYANEISVVKKEIPFFILISPLVHLVKLPEHCLGFSYYPASTFFEMADRIFTACGFNSMQQTLLYTEKHHFLPFPRKLDDQFQRANLRRKMKEQKVSY